MTANVRRARPVFGASGGDKSVKGPVPHTLSRREHKLALPKDAAKSPGLGLDAAVRGVFQVFVPEPPATRRSSSATSDTRGGSEGS